MPVLHDASTPHTVAANPATWSHTVADNSNRYLVVTIAWRYNNVAPQDVTAVTYNSDPLAQLVRQEFNLGSGNYQQVEQWGAIAPDVGAHDVSVTFPETPDEAYACASSFYGVDQGTPTGTPVKTTNTGTSITLSTIAGTPNGMAIDGLVTDDVAI